MFVELIESSLLVGKLMNVNSEKDLVETRVQRQCTISFMIYWDFRSFMQSGSEISLDCAIFGCTGFQLIWVIQP